MNVESEVCHKPVEDWDGRLALCHFAERRFEVHNEIYTIQRKFADTMRTQLTVFRAFNQPDSFETKPVEQLKVSTLERFPGEIVLKESARVLWNWCFNFPVKSIEKP